MTGKLEKSPITKKEVELAFMSIKNARCPVNVTTEMLVASGEIGVSKLTNIMCSQGIFPSK